MLLDAHINIAEQVISSPTFYYLILFPKGEKHHLFTQVNVAF
uniref:Uncharacterized protein n=1 Tax=Arundo donax TaxID=35708 RepID=A0A0A8XPU8_ARUDO